MKKLFLILLIATLPANIQISATDQSEQQIDTGLESVIAQAMTDSTSNNPESEQEKIVWYLDSQKVLEQLEWGPEFIALCKEAYQEYMLLGMLTQDDKTLSEEEKKAILQEKYKEILVLQRHLRSQIEPYIKQLAIDNNVDVIVDTYTGALIYVADHLSLEQVTVYS